MAAETPIVIKPRGRMANQMFQLMLARVFESRVPGARVYNYSLPEWGLVGPTINRIEMPGVVFKGQVTNIDRAGFLLRAGVFKSLIIDGWGMRLEYFEDPDTYRRMFQVREVVDEFRPDQIVIHIRGGDVMSGAHRDYAPMPLAFYESVIRTTRLTPVFVGQVDDGPYGAALRARFPDATFLAPSTPLTDFERLRSAQHIVLSVSSFAWLAAWLSHATRVHMPIWGLFDPERRPDVFLLPLQDERYVFYRVSPFTWTGAPEEVERLAAPRFETPVIEGRALVELAKRGILADGARGAQARAL